jgi:hypothetical protein
MAYLQREALTRIGVHRHLEHRALQLLHALLQGLQKKQSEEKRN